MPSDKEEDSGVGVDWIYCQLSRGKVLKELHGEKWDQDFQRYTVKHYSKNIQAVIKSQGPGISYGDCECGHRLLS